MDISSLLYPICDVVPHDLSHLFFAIMWLKDLMIQMARWWSLVIPKKNCYAKWLVWFSVYDYREVLELFGSYFFFVVVVYLGF